MDVNVQRLQLASETEKEFTKSCAIIDYEATKRILEASNNAILAGVKVNDIVKTLEFLRDTQKINLD